MKNDECAPGLEMVVAHTLTRLPRGQVVADALKESITRAAGAGPFLRQKHFTMTSTFRWANRELDILTWGPLVESSYRHKSYGLLRLCPCLKIEMRHEIREVTDLKFVGDEAFSPCSKNCSLFGQALGGGITMEHEGGGHDPLEGVLESSMVEFDRLERAFIIPGMVANYRGVLTKTIWEPTMRSTIEAHLRNHSGKVL